MLSVTKKTMMSVIDLLKGSQSDDGIYKLRKTNKFIFRQEKFNKRWLRSMFVERPEMEIYSSTYEGVRDSRNFRLRNHLFHSHVGAFEKWSINNSDKIWAFSLAVMSKEDEKWFNTFMTFPRKSWSDLSPNTRWKQVQAQTFPMRCEQQKLLQVAEVSFENYNFLSLLKQLQFFPAS